MVRLALPQRLRRDRRDPESRMSVLDHLRELRRRLVIALLLIAAGAVVGWIFYEPILNVLKHPYCAVDPAKRFPPNQKDCALIFTAPLDGFTTRLKVSFIAGSIITSPLWLYQIWAFITPGLRKNERRYSIVFIAASTVLFAAGVGLAYLVLSKGLQILIGTAGAGTSAALTVNSYLSFVTLMLVIFGAAFELPLIVVMANFAGVLSAKILKKSQRIAIFLIFLFAAIATPSTDPFTMCAMAAPMCLLFELAVLIAIVHDRRKARRKAAAAAAVDTDDSQPSRIDAIPRRLDDPWVETT
ncbi:MAG: twin-arginine translocase subunit TatC [Actinomycetota bacterium]